MEQKPSNHDQFARISNAPDLHSEQRAVKELFIELFAEDRTEMLWSAAECCKYPESSRLCFIFLGYIGNVRANRRLRDELADLCAGSSDSALPIEAIAVAFALANIGGIEGIDYLQRIIARNDNQLTKTLLLFAKRCTRFSDLTSIEGLESRLSGSAE